MMTFADFEARCEAEAAKLEDRLTRYISSPQEHDLALLAAWAFIRLLLERV
ncbi:MAG TPA: hypothetical protein VM531_11190 [Sphingomicrobium sp.]|jgi:hypothetical protein|nr:hypothetical protein [Sphingomicrobium sp.]